MGISWIFTSWKQQFSHHLRHNSLNKRDALSKSRQFTKKGGKHRTLSSLSASPLLNENELEEGLPFTPDSSASEVEIPNHRKQELSLRPMYNPNFKLPTSRSRHSSRSSFSLPSSRSKTTGTKIVFLLLLGLLGGVLVESWLGIGNKSLEVAQSTMGAWGEGMPYFGREIIVEKEEEELRFLKAVMAVPPRPASFNEIPKICVIARTYGGQMHYLPLTLLSLYNSGFPELEIFLVNTDNTMPTYEMEDVSTLLNGLTGKNFTRFLDWPVEDTKDFGFGLTDKALIYLYDHPEFGCDYVMFTNGDNLISRALAEHLQPGFLRKADLIAFDFISHYQHVPYTRTFDGDKHYIDKAGSFYPLSVAFHVGSIDLSAALFRMKMLNSTRLTFKSVGPYVMESDGLFIEQAERLAKSTYIQHATLLLHQ